MDKNREKNIGKVAVLNFGFTIVEIIVGFWTNSSAILADALHDFGDSIALFGSWIGERNAKRLPDRKRTFGYARISLLSALFSATILLCGSVFILYESFQRLLAPEKVYAQGMMIMAVFGIIVFGVSFYRLKKGESMNERVLSFHMLEDVLGWIAILLGGAIIHFTDLYIIDPLITIGYTIFILWNVIKKLKEMMNIFLQGVPAHISIDNIRSSILAIEGVQQAHDIHVWSLEGETDILTAHIIVEERLLQNPDATRIKIKEELRQHHIEHSTIELESSKYCSGIECMNKQS